MDKTGCKKSAQGPNAKTFYSRNLRDIRNTLVFVSGGPLAASLMFVSKAMIIGQRKVD
jgi:hypothetical protein